VNDIQRRADDLAQTLYALRRRSRIKAIRPGSPTRSALQAVRSAMNCRDPGRHKLGRPKSSATGCTSSSRPSARSGPVTTHIHKGGRSCPERSGP
jgi:hypothetical protein